MENGRWRAYSRLQNRWIDIPATRVEREREIPPGAHLCENSAGVICFAGWRRDLGELILQNARDALQNTR
jgi:hypothetical protein